MRILLLFIYIAFSETVSAQLSFHRNDTIDITKNGKLLETPFMGGLNAAQFSTMDLNFDGTSDLVVFDRSDDKLMTFINEGTTDSVDYRYAYEYEKQFPEISSWMLLRDFDGDGKKDIFCSANIGIRVYKNVSTVMGGLDFELYENLIISYQGFGQTVDSSKFFNLYVSRVDLPAIVDVDADGDLDVLTFGVLGSYVEYHRNMSMEDYGHADSMNFYMKNACWGYFSETGTNSNRLNFNDTCFYNVYNPQSRHAGSTVLAFDNDNDQVMDLLLGDVSFRNVVLAENGGAIPNDNASIVSQDTSFPSYDVPIDLELFPAMFLEDVNNDGLKDLICSPNIDDLVENTESVLFYKNTGTNSAPVFEFVQNNLIQDEAIETGERSNVSFFDHNGDGLMDMIVSSYGYFIKPTKSYESKLTLYENTGTATNPAFTFITDDYQNIQSLGLGLGLYPTFADVDGDNDVDMMLGNSEGKIHLLTNTAGFGNTAVFTLTTQDVQDNLATVIDVGQFSTPQLFDYDNDTDYDLIIGEKNGVINYYENIGTTTAPSFAFITDTMGAVRVREPWDVNGASTGYTTPFFFEQSGVRYMATGGEQGEVYIYTTIDPNDPTTPFVMDDTLVRKREIGKYTTTHLLDINNEGNLDLFMGNIRGGVASFYSGDDVTSITYESETKLNINVFPNPAQNELHLVINGNYNNQTPLVGTIYSTSGQVMNQFSPKQNGETIIDVNNLAKGVYIIKLNNRRSQSVVRFLKR